MREANHSCITLLSENAKGREGKIGLWEAVRFNIYKIEKKLKNNNNNNIINNVRNN